MTVHRISGAMTSGDSRPKADWSVIHFRNQLQVLWNALELIVTLDCGGWSCWTPWPSLMLSARNDGVELIRVLLGGGGGDSVRVLIPDDRAAPWGFHDVTLVDMAGATGPSVSKEDLS